MIGHNDPRYQNGINPFDQNPSLYGPEYRYLGSRDKSAGTSGAFTIFAIVAVIVTAFVFVAV